jgi:uncharacterized protein YkwD
MLRASLLSLVILAASVAAIQAKAPKPKPASYRQDGPSYSSSTPYDAEAEQQLLSLANQARARAGLLPLQPEEGLTQAARQHAFALAARQQLSHQFPGEPSLAQRLATGSSLHLSQAGENVASAANVEQAHEDLMLSPPHRANLLNPAYNVAGFAVVRSGYTLYVTQDFGQGSITHSADVSDDIVATMVSRMRASAGLPQLQRVDGRTVQAAACSMAQADSLAIPLAREITSRYVLRYTSMQLDTVPDNASKFIGDRAIHKFSAGSCYSRTTRYPNGVYWVVLTFY